MIAPPGAPPLAPSAEPAADPDPTERAGEVRRCLPAPTGVFGTVPTGLGVAVGGVLRDALGVGAPDA